MPRWESTELEGGYHDGHHSVCMYMLCYLNAVLIVGPLYSLLTHLLLSVCTIFPCLHHTTIHQVVLKMLCCVIPGLFHFFILYHTNKGHGIAILQQSV